MSKTIIKRLNIIPAKCPAEMLEILKGQSLKLEILMATVEELAGRLNHVVEQLGKVKDEVSALRDACDRSVTLPEDAELALIKLEAITQLIDQINTDQLPAAAEPATTEEATV